MKFIFSKSILTISQASVESAIREFGVEVPSVSADEIVMAQIEATADLKHIVVTEADGEITYEISDDLIVCYLGLYIKLVRAFVPVFKALTSLSDDVKSLVAMINERKYFNPDLRSKS